MKQKGKTQTELVDKSEKDLNQEAFKSKIKLKVPFLFFYS